MNKPGIYYTNRERNYVIKNYANMTIKHIAEELGKTEASIYGFMHRHRLKRSQRMTNRLQNSIKKQIRLQRLKDKIELRQLVQSVGNSEECLLFEMSALIKLCELTDNSNIRMIAKNKLRQLSGIALDNPYSLRYVG